MAKNNSFPLSAAICLALLLLLAPVARGAATQPMIEPHSQAMPLMPFLDYLVDETMLMDIEEASRANGWQPLSGAQLPREEGALWLRFTIAPIQADAKPQTFLLDMGQSVPGKPTLYEPVANELAGTMEWRENLPSQRNIILLPEPSTESQVCFIRLDGLPGPWFAPMIRTPHNAATNWGSLARPGAILALGVVMVLCFLRGLSESGQWRYWTALFVATALAQAIIGMPQAAEVYTARDLSAILLPGIALMILPHIGRHLMDTPHLSKSIDIQLFLLSLPGVILALLPLVPGWDWLERWVDLWPAGTLLFVPTALGAWMIGLPGSRRFLLACLILSVFTALAYFGLEFGFPANVLASGPAWGVVLAALILAAAAMAGKTEPEKKEKQDKELPGKVRLLRLETEPIINLEHPLDDPNLRLIPASENELFVPEPAPPRETALERCIPNQSEIENAPVKEAEKRELALREPVDDILRETSALGKCALPPSARKSIEKMEAACKLLANIISRPDMADFPANGQVEKSEDIFNLEKVLRNAHDSVASIAEYSGVALSWYMPPHLGPLFKGNAQILEDILRLLLESAARASARGTIKLSARHVPDSADPGHILFTVEDDGKGYPPLERSSLAFARAWELAGQSEGYLSIDCSANGAVISFSVHFTPVDNSSAELESHVSMAVALAASDPHARRNLSRIVETVECNLVLAEAPDEIISNQISRPAALLIAQGRIARPASGDIVREFIKLGRQAGFPNPNVLAITEDQSQWRLLKTSGFTHAMLEPVDPEVLRRTIIRLLTANQQEADSMPPSVSEKDKNPLFNENGASLDGNASENEMAAKAKDSADAALAEQNFSLDGAFEGPEWLGDGDDDLPDSTPASATVQPDERDAHMRGAAADKTTGPLRMHESLRMENEDSSFSGPAPLTDTGEWVGEPMPVGAPISEAASKSMAGSQDYPGAPNLTPPQNPQSDAEVEDDAKALANGKGTLDAESADDKKSGADNGESLLDYIVIPEKGADAENDSGLVEPNQEQINKESNNSSSRQGGTSSSTVMDFVNSSVAMVTNTLSSMLKQSPRKASEDQAPPAEQRKDEEASEADPVVMALVARLDEAMNQANAAFAAQNSPAVATATGLIAREADEFGLRQLARLANCVERAARANDLAAVNDLLPDLAIAVERNRIVILQKSGM